MRVRQVGLTMLLLGFVYRLGAEVVLLEEPFDNLLAWDDLSTAISWSGQPADGSAWETPGGILSLNAAGVAAVGSTPWDSAAKIRSFTCLDRRFTQQLEHRSGTLVIEVRVRWSVLNYTPYRGEWNRINLMLVHEYPDGGLDLTRDLRVSDFSREWWGRPAYQLRLRSTDAADATALLMYGGGYSSEGEFEIYSQAGTPLWWLPGFSSAAGGGSPGLGDPWPLNAWAESSTGLASTQWQRFRYVVAPDHQALYLDPDDDGASWIRDGYLPLPEEADAPVTAPLYRYFETFEGLRIYFRGFQDAAEIDYLDAWYAPDYQPELRLFPVDDGWRLSFPTQPGQLYTIQTSPDLVTWTNQPGTVEGNGRDHVVPVEVPAMAQRFFRLLSEPGAVRK